MLSKTIIKVNEKDNVAVVFSEEAKIGEPIIKYGEEIGVATINIETGEHT